jgi:hypothetical protein
MLDVLENLEIVGYIGTDGTADSTFSDHEHPGKNILKSRIDTWCCIYKRETSACDVSHMYYHEASEDGDVVQNVWDSSGLRQLALSQIHGYVGSSLSHHLSHHYIHYVAFSKNRHLDETNIGMYRQLMILTKIGHAHILDQKSYVENRNRLQNLLNQAGVPFRHSADVSQLAQALYVRLFSHVDQSNPYKSGLFKWYK